MSDTSARDRVASLAKTKWDRAMWQAMEIGDSWFACQALASVLRYAPDSKIADLVSKIERRVATCQDDYQRAAVRSWEIRALAERGLTREAERALTEAAIVAKGATPAPSRSEALFLLFQAAHPLGARVLSPIARMLADVWLFQPNWRSARNLASTLAMLSAINEKDYHAISASISDTRILRKVQRAISSGYTKPRPFF